MRSGQKFSLVFKGKTRAIAPKERIPSYHSNPIRLIFSFRPVSVNVDPGYGKTNSDGNSLRLLLKNLKLTSFSELKVICISGMYVNEFENARFIKYITVKSPKFLKVLAFRWCTLSEKLIFSLYQLLKERYEKNKPIDMLQIYRLYEKDISLLDKRKVIYLLSQTAIYCKKYFHTQTDSLTNRQFYHFFFTANDICSRKKLPSFISLGGQHSNPLSIFKRYSALSKHLTLFANPNGWSQVWNDSSKVFIDDLVRDGVCHQNS